MKKLRHNLMVCSVLTLWIGNIFAIAYLSTQFIGWMLLNRQMFQP